MSTPSRPLASHRDSDLNSRSSSPYKSRHSSPCKTNPHNSHQKKLPKLDYKKNTSDFHIYEDTAEEYELYHKPRASGVQSESLLHDDKENILQPKGSSLAQTRMGQRAPLAELTLSQFPGFLSSSTQLQRAPVQLRELYQPKHSNNMSRTLHKFNGLPSFITPPRDTMNKILYSTLTSSQSDDVDELEQRLIMRSNELSRKKRAMSVGVNGGKAHLVQKNPFQIFTH